MAADAYLAALDRRDFRAIAECFTDDADATYNASSASPIVLRGGVAVAEWLTLLLGYAATSHAKSSCVIAVDGDSATVDLLAIVHLLEPPVDGGRMVVRGVRYRDRVQRTGADVWRIAERVHEALWQYEVGTVPQRLLGGTSPPLRDG